MFSILAQSSSQQGGSLLTLLLPLILIAGLYFIMIRPQRQRQKQQQALLNQLQVGDDVVISGGIYGTLTGIDEETGTVSVEIAPGTEVHMLRQGVLQRLSASEDDAGDQSWDEPDEEAEQGP